jgi:hypothetical protein
MQIDMNVSRTYNKDRIRKVMHCCNPRDLPLVAIAIR